MTTTPGAEQHDQPDSPSPAWTNASVLALAGNSDPIAVVIDMARRLVLAAVDAGWAGPPFDPFELARLLGFSAVPHQGVSDAAVRPAEPLREGRADPLTELLGGPPEVGLEYNPTRPRGRLRFSIAHELAHTLFPDVAQAIRHRTGLGAVPRYGVDDDWQLELLCNIAAGEFLMPTDTLLGLDDAPLDVDALMAVRARFEVSTEALLRRAATLTAQPVAMVATSRQADDVTSAFRVDYTVESRGFRSPLRVGERLSPESLLSEASATGFTAKGMLPSGTGDIPSQVVGIPPYPGRRRPRVLALLTADAGGMASFVEHVYGDAASPRSKPAIIAFVVNDQATAWGSGFTSTLARKFRGARDVYRAWVIADPDNRQLGNVHFQERTDGVTLAAMVAQSGYGPSVEMRLRYPALEQCLSLVAERAKRVSASVHMPQIGTGQGGGRWPVIRELIDRTLARQGIPVTVYSQPGSPPPEEVAGVSVRTLGPAR